MGGKHFITDPLFPAGEESCCRPTQVGFLSPSQVNNCECHISALNLEQHVITVDSSRYGPCRQSVQNMFRNKFRRQ